MMPALLREPEGVSENVDQHHDMRRLWFAVGAVPDGVLTWPMQHPELHTSASVDGVLMIIDGVITAAGWVGYVKPVIYCGMLGALGGLAFWIALIRSVARTEPGV